jgi:hypothetical protein
MLWFFVGIAWIVLLVRVIEDIFRNADMGGVAKALWTLFAVAAPLLGVLIYLLVHGDSIGERAFQRARAKETAAWASARQRETGQ